MMLVLDWVGKASWPIQIRKPPQVGKRFLQLPAAKERMRAWKSWLSATSFFNARSPLRPFNSLINSSLGNHQREVWAQRAFSLSGGQRGSLPAYFFIRAYELAPGMPVSERKLESSLDQ